MSQQERNTVLASLDELFQKVNSEKLKILESLDQVNESISLSGIQMKFGKSFFFWIIFGITQLSETQAAEGDCVDRFSVITKKLVSIAFLITSYSIIPELQNTIDSVFLFYLCRYCCFTFLL